MTPTITAILIALLLVMLFLLLILLFACDGTNKTTSEEELKELLLKNLDLNYDAFQAYKELIKASAEARQDQDRKN